MIPAGWTTDGYSTAVIMLGVETLLSDEGIALIPEWVGALSVAFETRFDTSQTARLLYRISQRDDRDTLAAIARIGGIDALLPLIEEYLPRIIAA